MSKCGQIISPIAIIGTRSRLLAPRSVLAFLFLLTLLPQAVHAQEAQAQEEKTEAVQPEAPPKPPAPTGPNYKVTRFVPMYDEKIQSVPAVETIVPIDELMNLEITLGNAPEGFIAPTEGYPNATFKLGEVPDLKEHPFYQSAIRTISESIVKYLNDRGVVAVIVEPHRDDVAPSNQARPMRLVIFVGVIKQVRTVAAGDRIPADERVNNPFHQRILERSPLQGQPTEGSTQTNLVRKDLLDAYLYRLNRHPGRRVDAAFAPASDVGGVAMDLMVNENKPRLAYFQASNTGTETTNEWRQRFGFAHNQLTNNDDVLSAEYITGGFEEVHAFVGSYEAPFFGSEDARWRVNGSWGKFDASEVGRADEEFTGEDWLVGGQLFLNVYQKRELFVDLFAGVEWQRVNIENVTAGISTKATEDFFLPHVGIQLERRTGIDETRARVMFQFSVPEISNPSDDQLDFLGRIDADDEWTVLKWEFSHSMFLEPLLNRKAWEDVTDAKTSTLAHEIMLSFRGQYAFDKRLIPRHEEVIGGLYSVRGYPESVSAADTVIIGSVEYRFHLPRTFGIEENPSARLFGQPFRFAPQQVYGTADWDLILRAFLDVGRTFHSDIIGTIENENTLVGAGVGVEFLFKQNLSLRVDWGAALRDVEGSIPVSSGSSQWHFVATLFF